MITIKLLETKQVRSAWEQERETWNFSIVVANVSDLWVIALCGKL